MEIQTSISANKVCLKVAGKLTVQTSSEFGAVVEGIPHEICDIDIDLSGVRYVSSAGLRALANADNLASMRGGAVRLLHPQKEVFDLMEMAGLLDVYTVVA